MDHTTYQDSYLHNILSSVKTIALIGASPKPERASNIVMRYMLDKGYKIIPVNPGLAGSEIAGQKVFASLKDLPDQIDMVDIFRASDAVPQITKETLQLTQLPKVIWMQIGVSDMPSARKAEEKQINVVMNRCPKIEYERLFMANKA